jgi:hypothetical protein
VKDLLTLVDARAGGKVSRLYTSLWETVMPNGLRMQWIRNEQGSKSTCQSDLDYVVTGRLSGPGLFRMICSKEQC